MFCIMGMSSSGSGGAREGERDSFVHRVKNSIEVEKKASDTATREVKSNTGRLAGDVADAEARFAAKLRKSLNKKRATLVGGTEVTRTLVGEKMGVVQSLAEAARRTLQDTGLAEAASSTLKDTETDRRILKAGYALKEQLQLAINARLDTATVGVEAKQEETGTGWAPFLQWIPESSKQTQEFWDHCDKKKLLNLLGLALFVYTVVFATVAAFLGALYAPPIAAACAWRLITVLVARWRLIKDDPEQLQQYELWVMGIAGGEFGAAVAKVAYNEWWLVTIIGVPFTLALPALANAASKYVRATIGFAVDTIDMYLGDLLESLSLHSRDRGLELGSGWDRPLIRELVKSKVYKCAVKIVDGPEVRAGKVPDQAELNHIKNTSGDLDKYELAFVISKLRTTAKEDVYAVRAQAAQDVDFAKRATKAVLSRLSPLLSGSPGRIGTMFKWIAVVCLLPLLIPVFAIIAVLKVLAPLASNRFSLGGFATLAGLVFVEYSVVVYVAHVDTQVTLVAGIFVAVGAVGAFANRNALLGGPLLVVAFEAAVTAHDVVLADQVVYTLSAFLAIIVISKADPSFLIRVEYAAGWLLFRVLRLSTQGGASAESRWRGAQIMLIVVVIVHFMCRFVTRAPRGSPEHAVIYKAGPMLETQVSGGLILMVAYTYTDRDVLPLYINVWGIVLPLAYTICVTVPHKTRMKLKLVPTTAFAKLMEGVVCLGVLYIIGTCFMYTHSTVATGTPMDPCNPLLTNLHTCANGEQGTYVYRTCCRKKTHMLVPEANWARVDLRAAPVQECQVALSGLIFRDCCNHRRAEATDSLLGGPKACLCNSNVAGNTYSNATSACICNANYTGDACHIPVL